MRSTLNKGERLIIEGTQGYGLSLLHSQHYPYVTSRDTTAAGFLSETGLSPLDVDDVVLVLRAFPIRVSGNSGPLPQEINWDVIAAESGTGLGLSELTSVTRTVRRVARFEPDIVRQAIAANNPSRIVLNHLDHVDVNCTKANSLTKQAGRFVQEVESAIGKNIDYFGFGQCSWVNRQNKCKKIAER